MASPGLRGLVLLLSLSPGHSQTRLPGVWAGLSWPSWGRLRHGIAGLAGEERQQAELSTWCAAWCWAQEEEALALLSELREGGSLQGLHRRRVGEPPGPGKLWSGEWAALTVPPHTSWHWAALTHCSQGTLS